MELFKNRLICLFLCVFIAFSAMCAYTEFALQAYAIITVIILAILALIISFLSKKTQPVTLCVFLALFSVLLAMLNFYVRIDRRQNMAAAYDGQTREVLMDITEVQYVSENSSAFVGKIERIGTDSVNFKTRVVCDFPANLNVGDKLYASLELSAYGDNQDKNGILLSATLYATESAEVQKFQRDIPLTQMLVKENGIYVVVDMLKNGISERLDLLLGEDVGGLAKGFLLGDRSDISTVTVRDFRRTGLSHLFAVSGMHITLLLGAVDLILRKLFVHKYIRCVFITILTIPMLMLTGFSMSAVRSVLMLWIVYVVMLFKELADAPTTLFVSITIIILVFPYSVYDLGMYLSFLATLGLVTVFPYADRAIPRWKSKNKMLKRLLYSLRSMLMVFVMTLICTMFLLPLQWYVFGELSVISPIANVPLSPLSGIFMLGSTLVLVFGNVPILGSMISYAAVGVGKLIFNLVSFMSSLSFAMVSLRYFFADILVVLFTVAMLVLLTVKLKHKWQVFLPFAVFVLIFGTCALVYNCSAAACVTYYGNGKKELISFTDKGSTAIVDVSNATYSQYEDALSDALERGATTVDKIIFTEIKKGRISQVDYFIRSNLVESIYLPVPQNEEELSVAMELAELAVSSGSSVMLYEKDEPIELGTNRICVDISFSGTTRATSVIFAGKERLITYADALVFDGDRRDAMKDILNRSNTVIIGARHVPNAAYSHTFTDKTTLIYASEEIFNYSAIDGTPHCYLNRQKRTRVPIYFK